MYNVCAYSIFYCRFSAYFNSAHLPIFGKMYLNYKIGETDSKQDNMLLICSFSLI